MPDVFEDIKFELIRARSKFPAFNSAHEGWAVLDEECEELKREVYWGLPAERMALMRAEAIQVAAMAIRLVQDIIDNPTPKPSRTGEPNG